MGFPTSVVEISYFFLQMNRENKNSIGVRRRGHLRSMLNRRYRRQRKREREIRFSLYIVRTW
jgi:hypothetical protein